MTGDDQALTPTIPGPIYGLRVWGTIWEGGSRRLCGHGFVCWEPDGRTTVAECMRNSEAAFGPDHEAPNP